MATREQSNREDQARTADLEYVNNRTKELETEEESTAANPMSRAIFRERISLERQILDNRSRELQAPAPAPADPVLEAARSGARSEYSRLRVSNPLAASQFAERYGALIWGRP